MKRILPLLIAVAISIGTSSCSKSDPVAQASELITSICTTLKLVGNSGDVTSLSDELQNNLKSDLDELEKINPGALNQTTDQLCGKSSGGSVAKEPTNGGLFGEFNQQYYDDCMEVLRSSQSTGINQPTDSAFCSAQAKL
jgi:hypothetical protein